MTLSWAHSIWTTAGMTEPRCANANYAPAGREAAVTGDAGLSLLARIASV